MRMLVDERTMREIIQAIYINGTTAEAILEDYPVLVASPLAGLAVRTATKVREAALKVAEAHSLGLSDFVSDDLCRRGPCACGSQPMLGRRTGLVERHRLKSSCRSNLTRDSWS